MDEDNPRDAKRRKTNSVDAEHSSRNSPFSLLDDDSLRAVLLRTNGSDHRNLNLCCKRIRHALNSTVYRKERSDLGWAEVKVELLDSFEQYKREQKEIRAEMGEEDPPPSRNDTEFREEYDRLGRVGECGSHSFREGSFRVFVDGWPVHKYGSENKERKQDESLSLDITIVPRKTSSFYGSCDVLSDHLRTVGTTLFSNHGKPKVASLHNALKNDGTRLPLMYISEFKLPFTYRSISSTVGPRILQEVLKKLKDEYSLAIYIPCSYVQYSQKDKKEIQYREKIRPQELTDEQILEEQQIEERLRDLRNQDMRQFYRAGFRQVDDTAVVDESEYSFVFITRQDTLGSILSEQQALELPIASPLPPPKPKMGLPKQIFDILKKKCFYSRQFIYLQQLVATTPPSDGNDVTREELMLYQRYKACVEEMSSSATRELSLADRINYVVLELIDSTSEAIEGVLSQCETDEDRFRVILDSDAVHVCAAHQNTFLMCAVLKSLPDPPRQQNIALNHPDMNGFTPLMICAKEISRKDLDPDIARSTREYLESFIVSGVDRNAVNASTGLSALGYFRKGQKSIRISDATFGYRDPREEIRRHEAALIEKILEPDDGGTDADYAYLYYESELEEDEGESEDEGEVEDEEEGEEDEELDG